MLEPVITVLQEDAAVFRKYLVKREFIKMLCRVKSCSPLFHNACVNTAACCCFFAIFGLEPPFYTIASSCCDIVIREPSVLRQKIFFVFVQLHDVFWKQHWIHRRRNKSCKAARYIDCVICMGALSFRDSSSSLSLQYFNSLSSRLILSALCSTWKDKTNGL